MAGSEFLLDMIFLEPNDRDHFPKPQGGTPMAYSKATGHIVAKDLTRIYSMGSTHVIGIRDVSLTVGKGERVVLKGNSGSGKSTLLALLGGLDQPTRGTLMVDGQDLQKASPSQLNRYRRERVGMIFQSFNLLPTLSVIENVCLPALLAGRSHGEARERALEWLDWLGLEDRIHHFPSQLSGGEMQRTAIVRALINNPSIILADEPTGNLDTHNGEMVIELLAQLNKRLGSTVIIATHSTLADAYATMHVCLRDGVVTERTECIP
jgi:ABC-type lipoprotein export system ATPase subunit